MADSIRPLLFSHSMGKKKAENKDANDEGQDFQFGKATHLNTSCFRIWQKGQYSGQKNRY